MNSKELLTKLSIKNKGNFQSMMKDIQDKVQISGELTKSEKEIMKGWKVVTILDEEYPTELKRIFMPPLVLYYKGDLKQITDNQNKIVYLINDGKDSKESRELQQDIMDKKIVLKTFGKFIGTTDGSFIVTEYPTTDGNTINPERIGTALCSKVAVINGEKLTRCEISVALALAQGKDIYAVPHSIKDKSDICNKLIKDGAFVLTEALDLD